MMLAREIFILRVMLLFCGNHIAATIGTCFESDVDYAGFDMGIQVTADDQELCQTACQESFDLSLKKYALKQNPFSLLIIKFRLKIASSDYH